MSDDSSKQPPRLPWGIPAAIIVTLTAVVVMQPIAALLLWVYPILLGWDARQAQHWLYDSPVANFAAILLFELLGVAVILAFTAYKKVSFKVAVALRRIRWRDLTYAALGFLVYLGIAMLALTILPLLFPINADQEQAIGFEPGSGSLTLVLAFIGLVVLPPLVEELLFRGFLYGSLRAHGLTMVRSTIVTSLLFGALHLLGSTDGALLWIGFADTFLLSLVLCFVRERTGSIWASIGVHALKNGLVFINIFILTAQ